MKKTVKIDADLHRKVKAKVALSMSGMTIEKYVEWALREHMKRSSMDYLAEIRRVERKESAAGKGAHDAAQRRSSVTPKEAERIISAALTNAAKRRKEK